MGAQVRAPHRGRARSSDRVRVDVSSFVVGLIVSVQTTAAFRGGASSLDQARGGLVPALLHHMQQWARVVAVRGPCPTRLP